MKKIMAVVMVLGLAACTSPPQKRETYDLINKQMAQLVAEMQTRPAPPEAVANALLPPLQLEMPKAGKPLEQRFNLAFSNLPAQQFFMTLVNGTPYSMLVPPQVTGTISANLKDVTVLEALQSIREMYGYDYEVDGARIYIKPLALQTRVFHINYLTGSRTGSSETRVTSGSVSDAGPGPGAITGTAAQSGAKAAVSSNISTRSTNDFWAELKVSLEAIVGVGKDGRNVITSPHSGVVVVQAMWKELRDVEAYLKATQLAVDRQVIIEAKIMEVQLNDSFQAGVNWAAFGRGSNARGSLGFLEAGSALRPSGSLSTPRVSANPGQDIVTSAASLGGLFGLAFQADNFAALISFLETQGTVHVLSSPRIATLNNQKAVLKVGTDEFFVTNVSTTTTVGTATTTTPSVTLQPFFSGVALDVTPQIGEDGHIILHIRPSVSNVRTVTKVINLGSGASLNLPLASSSVSETDSVVRGRDGQVVAIGGLMRQASSSDRSQLPGLGDAPAIGAAFRHTDETSQKRELVILLKPTVVKGDSTWAKDMLERQQSIQTLDPTQQRRQ